jgi:hypothetical protein
VRTEGVELRALVPVSIRTQDQRGTTGNRIAAMRGPLPVYIEDPVKRLEVVRRGMDGLKESKQALGAEVISRFNDFAPPTLLAQASRLNFSTRLFNLIVTNVPGPQFPLYVLGRELLDLYPIAFLPKGHSLAIAIMSYNGGIDFGLLGDYDALPDIDTIADGIEDGLAQLRSAARAKEARAVNARAAGARPVAVAARAAPRSAAPRRRPATRAGKPAARKAATPATGARASNEPQLLPSGPTSRAEGPGASMRKRARKRPPSRNGDSAS